MSAGRRCPGPRCPVILTGGERYCTTHARDYEKRRGSTATRGYGPAHQQLRARFQAAINAGVAVHCVTCGTRLTDGAWDLGHASDRRGYIGPQCRACNRSEAGRRGATIRNGGKS